MYQCKNCGGNLKFDITTQQMHCEHCDSSFDPYETKKDTDAIEEAYYETNVFTCPQCGAELISSDTDVTSFCSYCGSANILSSRISKELRPTYIVPFRITKQKCKEIYAQKMNHSFFAPKELTDPAYIDGFRGIYMPYWSYNILQNGHISLNGKKSYKRGNYVYTEHYVLRGDLDASYQGYSYDASSSFYDNISQALAPFNAKSRQAFTPSFLSGFYADTADIDQSIYQPDACKLACEETLSRLQGQPEFRSYSVGGQLTDTTFVNQVDTNCTGVDHTLYPVWFMSYRNKDRIAYAAINGQTGKLVMDTPIDLKKYGITSAILAVVIFIFLNLFFTIKPTTLLLISSVLAILAAATYLIEINEIYRKNENLDDKGLLSKKQTSDSQKTGAESNNKKVSIPSAKSWNSTHLSLVIVVCTALIPVLQSMLFIVWPLLFVATLALCSIGSKKNKALEETSGSTGFWTAIAAVFIGMLINRINPVEDLFYYLGAIVSLAGVVLTLTSIIRNYNILATRKLPQFQKQGGDDLA